MSDPHAQAVLNSAAYHLGCLNAERHERVKEATAPHTVTEWLNMETAPHDGTWVALNVEYGGDVYGAFVGRWAPKHFDGLGTYQWEVIDHTAERGLCNHWSDGRMGGWRPLHAVLCEKAA